MAGSARSGTAAWLPRRPDEEPRGGGPHFARPSKAASSSTTHRLSTRPFRFGSEIEVDPDAPLEPGARIGERHRVVRLLGEGGMGRVYEAEHVVLERRVAIKLLRSDAAASDDSLARFQQEALAASKIGAPQIIEVIDFASHVGVGGRAQTYMVMELLVGESLEACMDRPGTLDVGLACVAELCEGLAAAHRAGVIHRDIKPANVFVRAPGSRGDARIKILDFGIAKITVAGEAGFQTQKGSLLGTPYYLAPERVLGEPLTPAADLYSVGVILYEMLVGDVPFTADSFMGVLARHVQTAPLDPRQAAPERGIPDAVAGLCMRLLAKQPAARGSAEQVAAELRALLAREGSRLAALVTGPREHAIVRDADTQVLSGDLHERATASLMPGRVALTPPEPALTPLLVEPASRRWPLVVLASLGLSVLVTAALVVALARDEVVEASEATPVGAADVPTSASAPGPEARPSAAAARPREVTEAAPREVVAPQPSDRAPPLGAGLAGPREASSEGAGPSAKAKTKSRKRSDAAVAPTPSVVPVAPEPQPKPQPEPKPIEDERVPTIKDDIYD